MVSTPPAYLQALCLLCLVGLRDVLPSQHGHRAGRLGQDALSHREARSVRLPQSVGELSHVELFRHLHGVADKAWEYADKRSEVRRRIQDEDAPRAERLYEVAVRPVGEEPRPTLARLKPESGVFAVLPVDLVGDQLDEVAQSANGDLGPKLGSSLAVETPRTLELVAASLGPPSPHESADDGAEVQPERASRGGEERQRARAAACCCCPRAGERRPEDANEVGMVARALPHPTHRREPRRACRGGQLQHLVEARQNVLVRDHQVEGREVAAVREERRLRRDHHPCFASGITLSQIRALGPERAGRA